MKPDQHKKKRSAQYKKKHGITQKKEDGKSTNQEKTKLSGSSLSSNSSSANDVKSPATVLPSSHSQSHHYHKDSTLDESERVRQFSRRKIESNWDRYEPLHEAQDDDRSSNSVRGADYKSLITQTGDATSQFRFKDEQIWEDDLGNSEDQESDGFPAIDCHTLSNQLRAIPLHIRLNIQETFFESSTVQSFNEIALRHEQELDSSMPPTSVFPSTWCKASPVVLKTGSQFADSNADEDTMVAKPSLHNEECHKMTPDCDVKSKESDAVQPGDLSRKSNSIELSQPFDHNRSENSSRDGGPESTAIRNTGLEHEPNDSPRTICPKSASPIMTTVAAIRPDSQAKVKSSCTKSSNPLTDRKQHHQDIIKDSLQPKSKTSEVEGEDELDFLLSLENPVQTRIKLGTSSRETAEGQDCSPRASQDPTVESSSKTNPVEAFPQNDSKTDDLEDWLDSILKD